MLVLIFFPSEFPKFLFVPVGWLPLARRLSEGFAEVGAVQGFSSPYSKSITSVSSECLVNDKVQRLFLGAGAGRGEKEPTQQCRFGT